MAEAGRPETARSKEITIYPLANPKGVKKECELCKKPALTACSHCKVTYYCSQEHKKADRDSIHEDICRDIQWLRSPHPFLSTFRERIDEKIDIIEFKKQLISKTSLRSRKLLYAAKHEESIPAALQALRLSTEVHGIGTIGLVPSLLLLAEAYSGMRRMEDAQAYVKKVEWLVEKTPNAPDLTKASLRRAQGRLFLVQGLYQDARRSFADDIYCSTQQCGSKHIQTADGYFHLARAFLKEGKTDVALSLFVEVSRIWFSHLTKLFRIETAPPPKRIGVGPGIPISTPETMDPLVVSQQMEAENALLYILKIRSGQTRKYMARDVATIYVSLSMLYFTTRNLTSMKKYAEKAKIVSERCSVATLNSTIAEYTKKIAGIK